MKRFLTCVATSAILLSGCSFSKSGIIQVNDAVITKPQFEKAINKEISNSPFASFGGVHNFVKSDENFMYTVFYSIVFLFLRKKLFNRHIFKYLFLIVFFVLYIIAYYWLFSGIFNWYNYLIIIFTFIYIFIYK